MLIVGGKRNGVLGDIWGMSEGVVMGWRGGGGCKGRRVGCQMVGTPDEWDRK